MAGHIGATIVTSPGSYVVMISQPQAVTDIIVTAAQEVMVAT